MDEESTYNRLFILGGKGCEESEWRAAFEPFGRITNIQVVTDRRTGEQKGIVYVTYDKISEAAKALEEMNGKFLPKYPKPLKVMIASSKREGNVKDSKEDEKILRLFIVCDKSSTEDELKDHFAQFGETEYVRILRDRVTKESKGLAYVKYYRAYHAALAYEGCNQRYKPRFAELKGSGRGDSSRQQAMAGGYSSHSHGWSSDSASAAGGGGGGDYYSGRRSGSDFGILSGSRTAYGAVGYDSGSYGATLEAMLAPGCSSEQIYKLFDIPPGLDSMDYERNSGIVYAKYQTPAAAAYAKEKLTGFEYPLGTLIAVRFYEPGAGRMGDGDGIASSVNDLSRSMNSFTGPDVDGNLSTLVKSIQKATHILEKAGLGHTVGGGGGAAAAMDTSSPPSSSSSLLPSSSGGGSGRERVRWCNVSLPYRQQLEAKDTTCEERLFIVSQPEAFPDHVLVDLLCRFGGLIDAYFMPGKNYGYAKFARLDAAKEAQDTLHGQTICNMRLKVIHADPPKFDSDASSNDKGRKRPRT